MTAWVGIATAGLPIVTAIVATLTAIVGIATFIASIRQRSKELRWKQAELARKLMDDIFDDDDAVQGAYMLDGVRYPFKDFNERLIVVTPEDVAATVASVLSEKYLSDSEVRILFCLDSFFYFLNRIEQSLKSKLILFEDISTPCDYYVGLIAGQKHIFSKYMSRIGYVGLLHFCERFPIWTKKPG